MRVCFFGTYEKDYPRNQILLKAMRLTGIEVIECHADIWKQKTHKTDEAKKVSRLLGIAILFAVHYPLLLIRYLLTPSHDLVLVGYPGHLDVIMLKLFAAFRRKKIVFDAFISLYATVVSDRKLQDQNSWMSRLLFQLDKRSCQLADRVILDTNQHIQYFSDTFLIPQNRFARIFAAADDELFRPSEGRGYRDLKATYHVLFCGKFTPFHGIDIILAAAAILENMPGIVFEFIGSGQLFEELTDKARKLNLRNVRFRGWISYSELPNCFLKADVCLGVFGGSEKLDRVIPNKIFQALAVRKPVITARSRGVSELLSHKENVYYVSASNADELANAIVALKNDPVFSRKLAENGYTIFRNCASIEQTGKQLRELFSTLHN